MRRVLFVVAGLAGCRGGGTTPKDSGTTTDTTTTDTTTIHTTDTTKVTSELDQDGDGFESDEDCDDTNPAVNPLADEICDRIDNDCDLNIDDFAPATLNGANFGTMDAALAAAVEQGGLLAVCVGSYVIEPVVMTTGALVIESTSDPSTSSFLPQTDGEAAFTLTGDASLTFTGFTVLGAAGAAFEVRGGAQLELRDVSLFGNGQGIYAFADTPDVRPSIVVEDSEISSNNHRDGDGGGIEAWLGLDLTLTDVEIKSNSGDRGGALFARAVFVPLQLTATNVLFENNSATSGGAVYLENVDWVGADVTIHQNSAVADGGGAFLSESSMSGTLITGNSAGHGGGVAVTYDPLLIGNPLDPDLAGVVVESNSAQLGGGVFVADGATVTFDGASAVLHNTAGSGGGVWLDGPVARAIATDTDFGSVKAANENSPSDVGSALVDAFPAYDDVVTFDCDGAGSCVPEETKKR